MRSEKERAPFVAGYSDLCAIALDRVVAADLLSSLTDWPDGLPISSAGYDAEVEYDHRDGFSYFKISGLLAEGGDQFFEVLERSELDWLPAPESEVGIVGQFLFRATSGPHPELINSSVLAFFDDLSALARSSGVRVPRESLEHGSPRFPLRTMVKVVRVLRRAGYQRRHIRVDWISGRVVVQLPAGLADVRIGFLPKECLLVRFIPRSGRVRVVEPWVAEDLEGRRAVVTLASIDNGCAMPGNARSPLEDTMRSLESLSTE
ncbi:MAG: hypothetical protein L6367_14025 [Cellulomonas sp.]|nr:hypothetical protein [Cellulomonas sp.]